MHHRTLIYGIHAVNNRKPTRWLIAPNEVTGAVTKQYMATQDRTDHHRKQ